MCQPAMLVPPGQADGIWNSHLGEFLQPTIFIGSFSQLKKFDQNDCSMWQTVKAYVHSKFYQASPWTEVHHCGNTMHVGSGSWDALSGKYHGFLCLKDWWAWDNIGSEGRILM